MKWSFRLVCVAGIDINLHLSFMLVLLYPITTAGTSGTTGLIVSALLTLGLFICVTMHELGHAFAARHLGIPVNGIVLWPLGGLTLMGRTPDKPFHEVLIMAAGPLVNLGIAAIALLGFVPLVLLEHLNWWTNSVSFSLPSTMSLLINGVLGALAAINLALAIFNLLPAYPLDGGRILHALLGMLIGAKWAGVIMIGISWPIALMLGAAALLIGDLLLGVVAVAILLASGLLNQSLARIINRGFYQFYVVFCYIANRGNFYIMKGAYARAIAYYDRVLQRHPGRTAGYLQRAIAYIHQQEYERAFTDINQVLQFQPDNGDAYRIRGMIWYSRGEDERAMADYAQALQLNPNDVLAHNNQGCIYHLKGDYAQALEKYNHVLHLVPTLGLVYGNRGQVYQALGDDTRALVDYAEAIQLTVDTADAYLGRGSIYYARSAHVAALADCDRAIAIAPDGSFSRDERWLTYFIEQHSAWAIVCYTRLLQHYPDQAEAYRRRGDAYRTQGTYAGALADYARAIAFAPGDMRAWLGRGWIYWQQGENSLAADDFQHVITHATSTDLRQQAEGLLRDLHTSTQAIFPGWAVPTADQVFPPAPYPAIMLVDDGAAKRV